MTFPNPFLKPLPGPEDMDDEENLKLVKALLGQEGLDQYGSLFSKNRKPKQKTTHADLLARAQASLAGKDKLLDASFSSNFERSIEHQYTFQLESLLATNFLETRPNPLSSIEERGLTAIDGNFYPVPTAEAITTHFLSIPNIKQKLDQGFTRLLIVPFGTSLNTLIQKTGDVLRKQKQAGKLLDRDNKPLNLDTTAPVYKWGEYNNADVSGDLVYYPTEFDTENHGGKTKQALLSTPQSNSHFPGYHILLIQEDPTIPREGEGTTKGNRPALEAGRSPNDYLEELHTNPTYQHEHGLTPEDWLTLLATNLHQKNKVIDDYQNNTDSINYLVGSYFAGSGYVPGAYWGRAGEQLNLHRDVARDTREFIGCCVAVG